LLFTSGSYNSTDIYSNFPMPAGVISWLDFQLNAVNNFTYSATTNGYSYTETYSKTASTNVGSYTGAEGTVHWGRYDSNGTVTDSTGTFSEKDTTHWAIGTPVTALPTSGVFTFLHVGGTQPTDRAGNVGNLTSGGSWTVNFGSRTIATATPVTWTMPNGVSYTVNASGSLTPYTSSPENGTSGGGSYSSTETGFNSISRSGTSGGSCSGNGCTMTNVVISPQFGGATATGLGLGITTTANTSSGTQNTAQVRVYTR
jgi:hypothetical protein